MRVIAPLNSSNALGSADFAIICSETAFFGHTCQFSAASPTTTPIGTSFAATSTSSVSSLGAGCAATGAGGVGPCMELKKI